MKEDYKKELFELNKKNQERANNKDELMMEEVRKLKSDTSKEIEYMR